MGCLWKVQERVRGESFAVKNQKKTVDGVLKFCRKQRLQLAIQKTAVQSD